MTTPANSSAKNRQKKYSGNFWDNVGSGANYSRYAPVSNANLPFGPAAYVADAYNNGVPITYDKNGNISYNKKTDYVIKQKGKKDKYLDGRGDGTGSKVPADAKLPDPIYTPTPKYKWNLPPHAWSLPVEPASVNEAVSKQYGTSDFLHSTRRGRIFYCAGYTGSEVKASQNNANKLTTGAKKPPSYHYGFQFMWNPETYTQNTAVNMELTYDSSDPYAALTSLVAANATVDFTIRLDRTNDFACFNSFKHANDAEKAQYEFESSLAFSEADENGLPIRKKTRNVPYKGYPVDQTFAAKYYSTGQPLNSAGDFQDNMQSKLDSLMTQGTMADLEYLFRAINGDGFNVLGLDTSNIGYLMPTIVRLDLGPQKWVGIIKNIGVTHLAFTQDMIPIRTDVTLSLDVRATTKQLSTASVTTPTATATTDPTTKK